MHRSSNHDLPVNKPGEELLFLREEKIRFMQDMLFLLYYENQAQTRPILQEHKLGHAHHRLLQIICHYPGLNVGKICHLLGITKQSLNRVLRDVLELNYVEYRLDSKDRRKKSLFLTKQGQDLEEELFKIQRKQFLRAFREIPNNTYIEGFQRILYAMLDVDSKRLLEIYAVQKVDKDKENGRR